MLPFSLQSTADNRIPEKTKIVFIIFNFYQKTTTQILPELFHYGAFTLFLLIQFFQ
jgi:hypothetical protein